MIRQSFTQIWQECFKHSCRMVHVDVHQTLDVMTLNVAELAFADLSCIQHQQANINISVDNLLTEFVIV